MIRFSLPLTGLLVLIGVYVLGGWALAHSIGAAESFTFFLYSRVVLKTTLMLFALFVGWRFVRLVRIEKPKRPTAALVRDIYLCLFTKEKVAKALPVFIGFIFFMSAFTSLKGMIPQVHAYAWDEQFARLDRVIHFGVDPWRILQPVTGSPPVTSFLNNIYNLWFPVMFAVLYWQLFDIRRPSLRMRFFWTFFLTWMLNGTVLAMILSSAGPCYYGEIVADGQNPYADLMAYLKAASEHYPVWAVSTQQILWERYSSGTVGIGSGISAMPSVHVAMATLFALLAFYYGRASRIFFLLFAAAIFIGSIHLGWHYAVDGYLGAAVTILIWWGTGFFFNEGRKTDATLD